MSSSLGLSPEIITYLAAVNPPEHPALARCRAETAALGAVSRMQISAEQGAFMQMLARLANAKRAFEIGVFTGYSSTATALVMQELHGAQAYLLACDVSEDWTGRARSYWREAEVERVIDLQIRPATETLAQCIARGDGGSFDFGFIDADKASYPAYYEAGLTLLRPGGIMLFDNVLWSGKVADPSVQDEDTKALRQVAQKAKIDDRVHAAMVGIGDGVLICMKK